MGTEKSLALAVIFIHHGGEQFQIEVVSIMRIIAAFICSLAAAAFASAATNDILFGNDAGGGTIWLRNAQTLGSINSLTYGATINGVGYLSDGRVVVAFAQNNGTVQIRNTDLSLVVSQSGFGSITALAIQHDNHIIVGASDNSGTVWRLDTSLNTSAKYVNFHGTVQALAVQSNDNIAIASDYGNGTLWLSNPGLTSLISQSGFATSGGTITALAVQSNNNIVVGSDYITGGVNYGQVWVRAAANLGGVASFINFGGAITALAVESNNNIVIAANYGTGRLWLSNPGLTSFSGVDGFGYVRALAVQSTGYVVAGSDLNSGTLWLCNPDLSLYSSLTNFGGIIRNLAVAPYYVVSQPVKCGDAGTTYLAADLNRDCYITFADFALLAQNWLKGPAQLAGDIWGQQGFADSYVNWSDLYSFAQQWLWCSDPNNAACTSFYVDSFYSDDHLNVANAMNFATVKSSAKTRTWYVNSPANLIDNDPNTIWNAGDGGPQWVEIDWKFPRYIQKVSFEEIATVGAKSYKVYGKLSGTISGDWQMLGWGQRVGNTSLVSASFAVQPLKSIKIEITPQIATDIVGLKDIKAYTDQAHCISDLQWHADWIWKNSASTSMYPAPTSQNGYRYFRYDFSVSNALQVTNAKIVAATKGSADIYVNNFLLKSISSVSDNPNILVDFRNYLYNGKNTIAIRGYYNSTGGWAGIEAEGLIALQDGTTINIDSNSTWKAAISPTGSWADKSYDDSSWAGADRISLAYSRPQINYWELGVETPYHFPGLEEQASLVSIQVPSPVQPGTWVDMTATLKAATVLTNNYNFALKAGWTSTCSSDDYRLLESFAVPTVATSQWAANQSQQVTFHVWIPEYAPPGESIPLTIYGTNGKSQLTITGTPGNVIINGSNVITPLGQRSASLEQKGDKTLMVYNGREMSGRHTYIAYNRTFENVYNMIHSGYELFSVGHYPDQPLIDTTANEDAHVAQCFGLIDTQCRLIAAQDPNARFLIALYYAPTTGFISANNSECVQLPNGTLLMTSTASSVFQSACSRVTSKMLASLNSQPYADRIIGYDVEGQLDGSWRWQGYDQGTWSTDPNSIFLGADISNVTLGAFRLWLQQKYVTDANLKAAWQDSSVTLATAQIRTDLRKRSYGSAFMNPLLCLPWSDYIDFRNDTSHELKSGIAQQIKSYYGGNIFVQQYSTSDRSLGPIFVPAAEMIGNGEQFKLCSDPNIDSAGQNSSYNFRRRENHYFATPFYGSLHAHDKIVFSELDNRTFLSPIEDYKEYSESGGYQVERLNFGADLCMGIVERRLNFDTGRRGQSTVQFTGTPEFAQELANYQIMENFENASGWHSDKKIAVFVNDRTPGFADIRGTLPAYNEYYGILMNELNFIGAPYDVFHIEDVNTAAVVNNYQLYIFLDADVLSQDQVNAINQNYKNGNKTLLWLWAPGYVDEATGFLSGRVQSLIGMSTAMDTSTAAPQINIDRTSGLNSGYTPSSFALQTAYVNDSYFLHSYSPHFYITDTDPNIETAGRYASNNQRGFVIRRYGTWKSVFCGIPYIPRQILRNIALEAGVNLYISDVTQASNIYMTACRDWIVLHNLQATAQTVNVTFPDQSLSSCFEVFSKSVLSISSHQASLTLQPYETKLLYVGYADVSPLQALTWQF
jgi:hypothetical protein